MRIDFANLQVQYKEYKSKIDKNLKKVLNKSNYILGEEVDILEKKLQKFTGSKHAITCSSGTDALLLSLMSLNIQPGDEIITTPLTWISTAETIALMKARPVFVDIDPISYNIDQKLIEAAITKKTKAIIPVSLYGQPADLNAIKKIANLYNLKVIIDGAQSFGSKYNNLTDSNLGDISITSFFPSKPLGCYGDGGAVFTNNDHCAEKVKMLRVHGQNKSKFHKYVGIGGRMDTIQAAILLAKLPYFRKELNKRQRISKKFNAAFRNILQIPIIKPNRLSAWAQYTIRVKNRDIFRKNLKKKGIPTAIYYPVPLHLQECFKYLNYKNGNLPIAERACKEVVSLPMNAFLTDAQINYIIICVKEQIDKFK